MKQAFTLLFLLISLFTAKAQYPFNDVNLSDEKRVDNLLSLMTLDEKINALGNNTYIPRLGIRSAGSVEGIHGVVLGGPAWSESRGQKVPTTVFPQGYGLGETWDTELIHRVAEYISTESRYIFQNAKYQKGGLVIWSPNADLGRDPRWGRTEECYGEDAYLTSRLVVSFVQGLQGDDPKYWRASSLMKHFLANSNEFGRTYSSSDFDETLFREYYSYPFYKGVTEGGSNSMMAAYNSYNGIPCALNPVLRNVVMKEWGLNGALITDGGAFKLLMTDHKAFTNLADAASACLKAGITKFLDDYRPYVVEALNKGLITEKEIEQSIRGNLRIALKLGLLDGNSSANPYARIGVEDSQEPWNKPETKAFVRKVADKSIVLLKNENHFLPLDKSKLKKVAVIGKRATEVIEDWYSGTPAYKVTVLDAIREELKDSGVEVRYVATNKMDSARTIAKWADVAIVCVGNHPWCDAGWEKSPVASEGKEAVDRLALSMEQEDLILQVHDANPKTAVVLISSFPYAINLTQQLVPAILHSTQSCQELGHGVSDVLFGQYNPAGRLTQTWPKSITDLPHMMDYDIRHGRTYMYSKAAPLYPFGHGLSYTSFVYSNLKTDSRIVHSGDTLRVTFQLRNSGARDGEEVVQLYVSKLNRKANDPIKQLKAFSRMALKKGDRKEVTLLVAATELMHWSEENHSFVLTKGKVVLEVGASSVDIRLKSIVEIQ